jgi:GntR family transcriptional regulator
MVHFHIATGTGVPSYRQIMDQVTYHVASGALRGGDPLPSIREMASRLSVNPSTIVKAYGELEHAGVIELRQGLGAFVVDGGRRLSPQEMKKALREQARRLAVEARQMGLARQLVLEIVEEELDTLEGRVKKR